MNLWVQIVDFDDVRFFWSEKSIDCHIFGSIFGWKRMLYIYWRHDINRNSKTCWYYLIETGSTASQVLSIFSDCRARSDTSRWTGVWAGLGISSRLLMMFERYSGFVVVGGLGDLCGDTGRNEAFHFCSEKCTPSIKNVICYEGMTFLYSLRQRSLKYRSWRSQRKWRKCNSFTQKLYVVRASANKKQAFTVI